MKLSLANYKGRIPTSIFFFSNGNVAVCDQHGQQYSRYQIGYHGDAVETLQRDGYDWHTLPEVMGSPSTRRQYTDEELTERLKEDRCKQ